MAKLVVRLNNEVMKEQEVGAGLTIGREAGDIILKNPAVSAKHARISVEKNHFVIHDMKSTNGTFVNKGRIASQELHHGDIINIGKFEMEFINPVEKESSDFFGGGDMAGMTVMIKAADLLKPKEKEGDTSKAFKKAHAAHLVDLSKSTGSSGALVSIKLEKETTLIGTGANADIKVKGFTVAAIAAAIAKNGEKFTLKYMGGLSKPKVNGGKVDGECELKAHDKIEIGNSTFEFRL
ncbi:MAG: FHA domain-containing protein [Nitrospinae bacterium]|nr:FHA domain-containing protein [Nitrospinota bacterium]